MGRNAVARSAFALTLAAIVFSSGHATLAKDLSDRDLTLYRAAFHAAHRENWAEAVANAAQAHERLPAKVIHWMSLVQPRSGHTFSEITAFISANPAWPNQIGLLRSAEETMPSDMPDTDVLAWFDAHAPVSAHGVGRQLDALIALGDTDKATELLRRFWVKADFVDVEDEVAFRRRFASLLGPTDHLARLDRALWEHRTRAVQRVLSLVDEDHRKLALARIALADDEPGLDATLGRVPAALLNDPGLGYERLHWRRSKGNYVGALDILNHAPPELGRPELWWTERNFLTRRLIEQHDAVAAYRLVTAHGLTAGQPLAEAEFLAGWLALRHLQRPTDALAHFQRMYGAVNAPMSRARSAYWCGRAADALGDRRQAQSWYGKASAHPTMFYGQLATTALNPPRRLEIPAEPSVSKEEAARFGRRGMVQVVRLLHEIEPDDRDGMAGLFLRQMVREAASPADWVMLARLASEIRRPDEAIAIAKQAFQAGHMLTHSGYPMIPIRQNGGIDPALALSVIRQESTFNSKIVSSAGARGLMQEMPTTARRLAKKLHLKLEPTEAMLTEDTTLNVLLGTAELRELLDAYRGSHVLAIAAYNAGSGRVDDWLGELGDPRNEGIDPVDWIESIPFAETRNYVQRVLEAQQVYRARFGQSVRDTTHDLALK